MAGTVVAEVLPIMQPRLLTLPASTRQPRIVETLPSSGLRPRDPSTPQATTINDGVIGGLVTIVVANLPPGGRVAVLDPPADTEVRGRLDALARDVFAPSAASATRHDVRTPSFAPLRQDEHQIGCAHAWMACAATALTYQSVTLTLRSIEFEAPSDYTLPR